MAHDGTFCTPEINRRTSSTRPPRRCTSSAPSRKATSSKQKRALTHKPNQKSWPMPFRICGVRESTVRVQRSPSEREHLFKPAPRCRIENAKRRRPTRPSSAGSWSAARNWEGRPLPKETISLKLFAEPRASLTDFAHTGQLPSSHGASFRRTHL